MGAFHRFRFLLALGLTLVVVPACNESESVNLAFRAAPGATHTYDLTLTSHVTTTLAGPPEEERDVVALRLVQEVVRRDGDEVALRITVTDEGRRPRVFDVELDTALGVASIDTVGGLPVEALGELGPSRLILVASGLLPAEPIRPGTAWDIRRGLALPEGKTELSGQGRLIGLRVDGGASLARVEAVTDLPLEQRSGSATGTTVLSGVEHTRALIDYDADDGTVHGAQSVTTGDFDLEVRPPTTEAAAPLRGKVTVRVESSTRLVG